MLAYSLIYKSMLRSCKLEPNWVKQMSISLEKIVEVMGNWFAPEKVGYVPVLA